MQKKDSLPINFGNQSFVLEQLAIYLTNPSDLDSDWIAFFQGMEFANGCGVKDSKSDGYALLEAYKKFGHLSGSVNPMVDQTEKIPELKSTLPEGERLNSIYSGNTTYECYNIDNKDLEKWFHEEVQKDKAAFSSKEYENLVTELWKAEYLEDFLQKKFLGAKRFSLEGGESFMPMILEIFEQAANEGYKTGIIGMAHRGRLNVLCNLLKKPYSKLFQEFNTKLMPPNLVGLGDVKYHKGYKSTFNSISGNTIELVLASNPSHLESVDPVVLGFAKACKEKVLPLIVHGDASVAGQGVVYEILQCSKLKGYAVGGAIHIVINNQVGFTASPEETRSTRYCTDIAKAFGFPVIHVNADDPVACVRAARLAFNVKNRFSTDVFIDLNCCRIYGHNEADEPRFTNPLLYQKIEARGDVYERVKKESGLPLDWIVSMENGFKEKLDSDLEEANRQVETKLPEMPSVTPFKGTTAVSLDLLKKYIEKITDIPKEFHPHPKLEKLFSLRREALAVDWATAELLAYASLLDQAIPVRLSGQDSKRGTFSHRHAVLFDQTSENSYIPLEHVSEAQAIFQVYNSPLSEYAVLGFEFGYSLGDPKALVIWEAQFGDFANGAQIIIDQYLAGSETKWGIHSGLTMFLPHGHEGMGPEHTSCRIERFLELSGQDNWQVVYPSTPAQFFHILRKQALQSEKRPLIIPTPKSMLRLTESFSTLNDLATGQFEPILDDTAASKDVKRIVLCTGKFYYELKNGRGDKGVALIRIEQLYPFPTGQLEALLKRYSQVEKIIWAQEEPKNQGAWGYISEKIKIEYVGRGRIPVPDTGAAAFFHYQQEAIIKEALG